MGDKNDESKKEEKVAKTEEGQVVAFLLRRVRDYQRALPTYCSKPNYAQF